jgi:hypothetical protein
MLDLLPALFAAAFVATLVHFVPSCGPAIAIACAVIATLRVGRVRAFLRTVPKALDVLGLALAASCAAAIVMLVTGCSPTDR